MTNTKAAPAAKGATVTPPETLIRDAVCELCLDRDKKLEGIAKRLGSVDRLKVQTGPEEFGNAKDFRQVHVNALANMLLAAYNTGAQDALKGRFPCRENGETKAAAVVAQRAQSVLVAMGGKGGK